MLNLALRGTDPVVFFESQRLYPEPETLVEGGVPTDYYEVPEGEPAVRRAGSDVTIVTIGATLYRALEAADDAGRKARSVAPRSSTPASSTRSTTARLSSRSRRRARCCWPRTPASADRSCTPWPPTSANWPSTTWTARWPWSAPATGSRRPAELEEGFFPQTEWIIDTLHERILPLAGHVPTTRQATGEILMRNRAGV